MLGWFRGLHVTPIPYKVVGYSPLKSRAEAPHKIINPKPYINTNTNETLMEPQVGPIGLRIQRFKQLPGSPKT